MPPPPRSGAPAPPPSSAPQPPPAASGPSGYGNVPKGIDPIDVASEKASQAAQSAKLVFSSFANKVKRDVQNIGKGNKNPNNNNNNNNSNNNSYNNNKKKNNYNTLQNKKNISRSTPTTPQLSNPPNIQSSHSKSPSPPAFHKLPQSTTNTAFAVEPSPPPPGGWNPANTKSYSATNLHRNFRQNKTNQKKPPPVPFGVIKHGSKAKSWQNRSNTVRVKKNTFTVSNPKVPPPVPQLSNGSDSPSSESDSAPPSPPKFSHRRSNSHGGASPPTNKSKPWVVNRDDILPEEKENNSFVDTKTSIKNFFGIKKPPPFKPTNNNNNNKTNKTNKTNKNQNNNNHNNGNVNSNRNNNVPIPSWKQRGNNKNNNRKPSPAPRPNVAPPKPYRPKSAPPNPNRTSSNNNNHNNNPNNNSNYNSNNGNGGYGVMKKPTLSAQYVDDELKARRISQPLIVSSDAKETKSSGFSIFKKKSINFMGGQHGAGVCQGSVGTLLIKPEKDAKGWIYAKTGMYPVIYEDNLDLINSIEPVKEGQPCLFDSFDGKNAVRVRMLNKLDDDTLAECVNDQGATLHSAKYYINETKFSYSGTLTENDFQAVKSSNVAEILSVTESTLNAFVNTKGGTLYIGIGKDYIVKGVSMSKKEIDSIQRELEAQIQSFRPNPNLLSKFQIGFVPVVRDDGCFIENTVVIRCSITGPIFDPDGKKMQIRTKAGEKYRKQLSYVVQMV